MRSLSARAVGVAAAVAVIGMIGIGSAGAATPAHVTPFAAQVKAAGLNDSQATLLQNKVDQILHQYKGAKQVAANEISLPHGSSVLLPLPGRKYARVLPGAVNLGFAPATSASDSVRPNVDSTCPYEYLCMWQGQTWTGEEFNVSTCNEDQELPGSGWDDVGSFWNHQTPGTSAFFLDKNKNVIATVAPEESNYAYPWGPVWYADACNH